MRSLIVPIADLHSLLKIGLMPPRVVEYPGTKYQKTHYQTPTQKWLWRQWKKRKAQIFSIEADELIVFLMGDMIHGDKKGYQVHTTKLRTQSEAAVECLLPYANRATCSYAVAGTQWHVGDDSSEEAWIAHELGCYGHTAYDKMEVTIQGLRFMLQHKGPSLGSRAWLKGNGMRLTLRDAHFKALQNGKTAADVYLWAHWHTYHHEPLELEEPKGHRIIRGFTLPAWCTADEYSLTVVKNLEFSNVGFVYFIVEDGKLEWHRAYTQFDNVTRVKHERSRVAQPIT